VPDVIEDPAGPILDSALLARAGYPHQMVVLLRDGLVKLVDLASYKTVNADFLRGGEHAQRVACSADGNRIAIGYSSSSSVQVAVFDVNTGERTRELIGAGEWEGKDGRMFRRWEDCELLSLSEDGSRVVAVSNNWLAVWRDEDRPEMEEDTEGPFGSAQMWTDVVATPTKVVWLQNTDGGHCVRSRDLTSSQDVTWTLKGINKLFSLDISPDRMHVVAGGEFSGFKWDRPSDAIWDWSLDSPGGDLDHPLVSQMAEAPGRVYWTGFTPNGALIVVCEEMNPPSKEYGDLGYRGNPTGNRFITVWDCPRRFVLS